MSKTIEERAKDFVESHPVTASAMLGYLQGATEQRAIDYNIIKCYLMGHLGNSRFALDLVNQLGKELGL